MQPTLSRMTLVSILAACCVSVGSAASAQPAQSPVIHHDLAVTVDPASHRLKVRDRIRIPGALVTAPFTLSLNADLDVQALPGGLKLVPITPRAPGSGSGIDRDDHDPGGPRPGQGLWCRGRDARTGTDRRTRLRGRHQLCGPAAGRRICARVQPIARLDRIQGRLSGRLDPLGAAGRGCADDLHARGRPARGLEIGQPGRAHLEAARPNAGRSRRRPRRCI